MGECYPSFMPVVAAAPQILPSSSTSAWVSSAPTYWLVSVRPVDGSDIFVGVLTAGSVESQHDYEEELQEWGAYMSYKSPYDMRDEDVLWWHCDGVYNEVDGDEGSDGAPPPFCKMWDPRGALAAVPRRRPAFERSEHISTLNAAERLAFKLEREHLSIRVLRTGATHRRKIPSAINKRVLHPACWLGSLGTLGSEDGGPCQPTVDYVDLDPSPASIQLNGDARWTCSTTQ